MNKVLKSVAIVSLLVFIDLASKYLIYDLGFLNSNFFITPILNTGISWGISLFHFNLLIFIIPLLLILIYYLYIKKEISYWVFILIFSGGLANFLDRIMYHGVRDFIDFHFFPIFNIADIFVSLGVVLLVWQIYKNN